MSLSTTEEVKGEKDVGKDVKAAKEEAPRGNGKPPAERLRFMFNIADGGFTGWSESTPPTTKQTNKQKHPGCFYFIDFNTFCFERSKFNRLKKKNVLIPQTCLKVQRLM